MKRARILFLVSNLFVASGTLVAQDPSGNASKPPEPPPAQNSKDSYAVSVGTGELINLSGDAQNAAVANTAQQDLEAESADGLPLRLRGRGAGGQLFYGLSVASVYTDNFPGLGTHSAVSTTLSPYVALLEPTRTGNYLLQYSAVVVPHDVITEDTRLFQTGGLLVQGALNRRLSWNVAVDGSYGSQNARIEGPLAYSVVQSTPMVNSGAAAVLLGDVNVLYIQESAGLEWRKSAREAIGVTVIHALNGIGGNPTVPGSGWQYSNALGVKAGYNRVISSRYTLLTYGEADAMVRLPLCSTYGGGAGLAIRVNEAVALKVEGGPQISTQACGGGLSAAFDASLAVNLTRRDRVYLAASRLFTTAYQTTGIWEDTVSAGFAKDIGRLRFTTDAGWIRAEERPPVPTYHGYFVAPRVTYRLTESLGVSAAYRNLHGAGGTVGDTAASFAAVSLDWHPAGKRLN